jgi:hypothetical protein
LKEVLRKKTKRRNEKVFFINVDGFNCHLVREKESDEERRGRIIVGCSVNILIFSFNKYRPLVQSDGDFFLLHR